MFKFLKKFASVTFFNSALFFFFTASFALAPYYPNMATWIIDAGIILFAGSNIILAEGLIKKFYANKQRILTLTENEENSTELKNKLELVEKNNTTLRILNHLGMSVGTSIFTAGSLLQDKALIDPDLTVKNDVKVNPLITACLLSSGYGIISYFHIGCSEKLTNNYLESKKIRHEVEEEVRQKVTL